MMNEDFQFDDEKQFQLYEKLMLLAMEKPNEINGICMKVIIALSKINEKTDEEFKELLTHMENYYKSMGSMDEIIVKVLMMELGGSDAD